MSGATDVELIRDFLMDGASQPRWRLAGCEAAAPQVPQVPLPCVVAIGAFDGCHCGHAALVRAAVADARARGIAAVAVTFDPDPDQVLATHPAPQLTSLEDRCRALERLGTAVAVVPFTRELAALDHASFFERILAPVLDVRSVHVGCDFRMGAGGASGVRELRAWGTAHGVEVHGHDLLELDGAPVSATRIRHLLAAGELTAANAALGRRYMVRGQVAHGRGEGADMGVPTANVALSGERLLPAEGVYAGYAAVGARVWPAAINVGLPPMFRDSRASAHLEANLLGYTGDLYGSSIAVSFDTYLRPSQRFASVEELIEAVQGDIARTRALAGAGCREVRA